MYLDKVSQPPVWVKLLAPIYQKIYEQRKNSFLAKRKTIGVIPVLSIGAISMGGSGKTPLLKLILNDPVLKLAKTAVIVKDTKSKSFNPALDEAMLLEQTNSFVSVYPAYNKITKILEINTQNIQPDWIFIDDGFQLFSLEKLEIVVLKPNEIISPQPTVPIGYARENLSALNRAHFVVIRSPAIDESLTEKLLNINPQLKVNWVYDDLNSFVDIQTWLKLKQHNGHAKIKAPMDLKQLVSDKVYLWAGTAQPQYIAQFLEAKINCRVFVLPTVDHDKNYNNLLKSLEANKIVLTTEKDANRFKNQLQNTNSQLLKNLYVIEHNFKWHTTSPVEQMLKEAKAIYEAANI